tara:strand:+ start:78 stop:1214 length:1137 start_codon:yes stop_codon:yes gene_type:complete
MSYSQLLSQYADKMNSARAHTEDYAKQNQDMKAQTLQEKFNSIAEPLTQGAEGLSSFGAAFHTGRKIYKKVKDARAAAAKAGKPTEPSSNPSSEGGPTESGGGEPTGPTEGPAPARPSGDGGGEGGADLDSQADAIQQRFANLRARVQGGTQPAQEAQATPASEASVKAPLPEEDIPDNAFSPQAEAFQSRATQLQQTNSQTSASNAEDSGAQRLASKTSPSTEGTTQVGQAGEGEAPTDTLAGTGRATGADLSSAPGSGDAFSAPRSLGQSVVRTGASDASAGASSGADAIAQAGTGAEQATSNIIQKAGTKALGGIADAAPEALDFLGPVGMGIGAITGLVDLFENIFNKPKTPEEETQTGAAAGEDVAAEQRSVQ